MTDSLNVEVQWDTFTATADEAISAGSLVKAVDSSSEISRTGNIDGSFEVGKCDAAGDELYCVGVAMTDVASGGLVAVNFSGIHRFRVSAAVSAGARVQFAAGTDPYEVKTLVDATINAAHIGRALTEADAANEYILVRLNVA